ncbi:MAG: hypothetical protein DLM64_06485 [Solirubrobacterales bacterium]|nr:MAG: hypothetical protein DLM64_06485 [Solirubrobacterales bacterium]
MTHVGIDELKAVEGFLEGFTFRRAGAQMGVTPFGMSIIDMPAETTAYPEHDHSSEGSGNPPAHQLDQEEVYIALRGSADVQVDDARTSWTQTTSSASGRRRGARSCRVLTAFGSWRSADFPVEHTIQPPPSEAMQETGHS